MITTEQMRAWLAALAGGRDHWKMRNENNYTFCIDTDKHLSSALVAFRLYPPADTDVAYACAACLAELVNEGVATDTEQLRASNQGLRAEVERLRGLLAEGADDGMVMVRMTHDDANCIATWMVDGGRPTAAQRSVGIRFVVAYQAALNGSH